MRDKTSADRTEKHEKYLAMNRSYANVFGTPDGMRVLDDILSKGHFYSTTFTGDNTGMFLEGKRDLALYVMKRLNTADSNIMIKVMSDNQKLKLAERK